MAILFRRSSYVILIAGAIIVFAMYLLISVLGSSEASYVTATVERGSVTDTVSVSGFVEAKNTAELAFPSTGRITDVFVDEGDTVIAGEVLATLGSARLAADRNEAVAALQITRAEYSETLAGPTNEARAVTTATVDNARNNLALTTAEQSERVASARATLLSSGLTAYTTDPQERSIAPVVSGTYTCDAEGRYEIDVYSSGSITGYSYRYGGLEDGSNAVSENQETPLGSCGLFLTFDADQLYDDSTWIVEVPNTRSSTYVTNLNAYELALTQQETALEGARDNLVLVSEQATEANATARTEVVTQRSAAISQATARIAQIDAQLADLSIVAPFPGIVTSVEILPGETAGAEPVITVLAEDAFELTARIPEIDIRKIAIDQSVTVVFDANAEQEILGYISYVSPLATQIDGVAYFETTIVLDENPAWIRSGLNADIDITISEQTDVLRLPRRYVTETGDIQSVQLLSGGEVVTTEINTPYIGNDGYVVVDGLNEGDEVIAP